MHIERNILPKHGLGLIMGFAVCIFFLIKGVAYITGTVLYSFKKVPWRCLPHDCNMEDVTDIYLIMAYED